VIYLVRHGQTEWNAERRMQGRMESSLTALGRRQAAAMAEMLAERLRREGAPPGWRLVSSPLGRARDTAEAIGARLDLAVELDDRLTEIAFGDWEGRLRDEVTPGHPELFATREWLVSPPNGETFEAVRARVASFLADLPPEPARRVIAVSHGVTGRLLRGVYAGLGREETLNQDVPQDAVFQLRQGRIRRFDCAPIRDLPS
jgi:probable phosphoglycerate mutase